MKPLLWPARDRRDLGGPVVTGELRVSLADDEGAAVSPPDLWRRLCAEAPGGVDPAALAAFGRALQDAVNAAIRDDLPGVLALQEAFDQLARNVKPGKDPR